MTDLLTITSDVAKASPLVESALRFHVPITIICADWKPLGNLTKMLALYQYCLKTKSPSILFVDAFDAKLQHVKFPEAVPGKVFLGMEYSPYPREWVGTRLDKKGYHRKFPNAGAMLIHPPTLVAMLNNVGMTNEKAFLRFSKGSDFSDQCFLHQVLLQDERLDTRPDLSVNIFRNKTIRKEVGMLVDQDAPEPPPVIHDNGRKAVRYDPKFWLM